MKKLVIMGVMLLMLAGMVFGQQITRVGVIDLQKVYMTYYKDSQAVRAFEEEKQRAQDEIKRLGDEIRVLQARRLELQTAGNTDSLKALDETLYKKAQFLQDYIKVKQAELDEKAKALSQTDTFAQLLYRTVQSIAELEGFSLVLSSRNANDVVTSIIWFSPMIDISDKVIQALVGTNR